MKGLRQLAAVFWLLDRTHAEQDNTSHTVSMVIFTVLGYNVKGCSIAYGRRYRVFEDADLLVAQIVCLCIAGQQHASRV